MNEAVQRLKIEPLTPHANSISVSCGRDKSLTHRAIMFSALANGESYIHHPLMGEDCLSTLDCFAKLGVEFRRKNDKIQVISKGCQGFRSPDTDLDCGNSGTTARLICGILASLPGLECRLVGDESLSKRPMGRVVDPLSDMGGVFSCDSGKTLPIKISGRVLSPYRHHISKATAQVKSALLLAGLNVSGEVTVKLPAGSRDHTEKMLVSLGADCRSEEKDGCEQVTISGPFQVPSATYTIPVDPSSAAFFAVFGLLRPKGETVIKGVLKNDTRTGFIKVLQRMSEAIKLVVEPQGSYVEPVQTLQVSGGKVLKGVEISAGEVPTLVDEVPILAVLAGFAQGPSIFRGLGELRVKESDRLTKTLELLNVAGCSAEVQGDDLLIPGGLKKANAFSYDPVGDHRLAMSAAIIAKFSDGQSDICDPACVAVSFPNFYEELERFELEHRSN